MIETIIKRDEPLLATERQKRHLAQLIYTRVSDTYARERWLDYLETATRDEANQILLDFS